MATALVNVTTAELAIWEWLHESGTWMSYAAPVSNAIERRYGAFRLHPGFPINRTFSLSEADANLHYYTVDLQYMTQTRVDTARDRPIRRSLVPAESSPLTQGVMWEWSGHYPGDWHQYETSIACRLEEAQQKASQSIDIDIQGSPYSIDLNHMQQQNKHSGFVRQIRRRQSGTPYTAVNTPNGFPLVAFPNVAMPTASSYYHRSMPLPQPAAVATTSQASASATMMTRSSGSKKTSSSSSPPSPRKRLKIEDLPSRGQYILAADTNELEGDSFHRYLLAVNSPPKDEDCAICCEELLDGSGYDDNDDVVLQFERCRHMYHRACVMKLYESGLKNGCIQCPTCNAIYGTKTGNCPPGRMDYVIQPQSLPGHPDVGTIHVTYDIQGGIQGHGHPTPGKPYGVRGFPRRAYLPACHRGKQVLKMLVTAWQRRLTFTIGTSATTSEPNVVIWNEIHHKTEAHNASGHGFPDPNYLDNVIQELKSHGISDDDCTGGVL